MKFIKIGAIILFILPSVHSFAQTNFNGSWLQTQKTSLSGKNYSNGLPTKVTIRQAGNQLTIGRTNITGNEEHPDTTITEQITIDGIARVKTAKRTVSVLAQYGTDHHGFKETTGISAEGQPAQKNYEIVENWELSADGNTLTISKTFTNYQDAEDKWSMTGTYQKQ